MPLYDESFTLVEHQLDTNDLLFLVAKDTLAKPFTLLPGFSIGEPDTETQAKVQIPNARFANGQIFTVLKTKRPEYVTQYTFEIGFPPGNFVRTPLSPLVRRLALCPRDYLMVNLCADDACKQFYFWLKDGQMGQLQLGQLITPPGDDITPITSTAPLDVGGDDVRVGFYIESSVVTTVGADALYAIALCEQQCLNCDDACRIGVYGGANNQLLSTGNAFASGTSIVPAALPASSIVTDTKCFGELTISSWTDNVDPALATDGGIIVASDLTTTGGEVVTLGTGMYAVSDFSGGDYSYIAAGAGGEIYGSISGTDWTLIPQSVTTAHLTTIDMDYDNSIAYIGGDDGGSAALVTLTGSVVRDITVQSGAASTITTVAVLGSHHIMVGDDNGDLRETFDVTDGTTFLAVTVGATGAIYSILGDSLRQFVSGAAGELFERSPLTDRNFKAMTNVFGSAFVGQIRKGVLCEEQTEIFPGSNVAYWVTDANPAEIIVGRPCAPNFL